MARSSRSSIEQDSPFSAQAPTMPEKTAEEAGGVDDERSTPADRSYEDAPRSSARTSTETHAPSGRARRSGNQMKALTVAIVIALAAFFVINPFGLLNTDDGSAGDLFGSTSSGESACLELVEERMAGLVSDDDTHELVVEQFDEAMVLTTGFTAEELGIDADEFADWYLSEFWYDLDEAAYAHDASEGVSVVTFYVAFPDISEVKWFGEDVYAYLGGQHVWGDLDQELDEAQLAYVDRPYQAMLTNFDTRSHLMTVYFERVDGEWTFDEDAWTEELEETFTFVDIDEDDDVAANSTSDVRSRV